MRWAYLSSVLLQASCSTPLEESNRFSEKERRDGLTTYGWSTAKSDAGSRADHSTSSKFFLPGTYHISWEHEAGFTVLGLQKPFPDMLVHKVSSTTASQESLAQAREWLEICQTSRDCLESRPGAGNTAKAGHRRQSTRGQVVRDKIGDRAIHLSKSLLEPLRAQHVEPQWQI